MKRGVRAAFEMRLTDDAKTSKFLSTFVVMLASLLKTAQLFARLKFEKRQKSTYNRRRHDKRAFERHRRWRRLGALRVCSHRLAAAAAAAAMLLLLHRRRVRRLLQVEMRVASRRPPLRVLSGALTCHEIVNRTLLRRNAERRLAERFLFQNFAKVFVAKIAKRARNARKPSIAANLSLRHAAAVAAIHRRALQSIDLLLLPPQLLVVVKLGGDRHAEQQ